ncbi:TPA: hypothetical protein DEB00_00070 [Candidatus Uhrbacteria bacterium]|nr:hypothetical protein [Candidatus Uhrbacteria bacterium]
MAFMQQRQRRVNPYFRQNVIGSARTLLVRVSFGIGLCALLALLLYGPLFDIRSVRVEGASPDIANGITQRSQEWLGSRGLLILPRRNRFFLDASSLESVLLAAFPLNTVTTKREGRTLVVQVNEKIRTFYLLKMDQLYAVDRFGMVLEQVDDLERARIVLELESGISIPIITDERAGEIREGQPIIAPAWLENIVTLFDALEEKTMLTPQSATIIDEEGRVDVKTDAGVTLYINIEKSIDTQVEKLAALIDRRLVSIEDLSYIDLRFTNRLFYH